MMVHDRKSKRSKTRGLSPSLPGTSRSNESSMAPLDVGQTAGLTMGPYCQERGFLQAHLCQRNVRGSEPRTLHRVRPWMTCALRESFVATSSQSFFLFFLFFFFFILSLFSPSFLPFSLGNSLGSSSRRRAIVREATSKFFANGPLMARGYTRVVFSNEPVGVSSLITRITSTGKPSVRTRETTPFPSSINRPLRILQPLELAAPLEARSSL